MCRHFTFENIGKYTLYFEAENARGKVKASVVFNITMELTDNEKYDVTNNIKQGSGSSISFNIVQTPRTNENFNNFLNIFIKSLAILNL